MILFCVFGYFFCVRWDKLVVDDTNWSELGVSWRERSYNCVNVKSMWVILFCVLLCIHICTILTNLLMQSLTISSNNQKYLLHSFFNSVCTKVSQLYNPVYFSHSHKCFSHAKTCIQNQIVSPPQQYLTQPKHNRTQTPILFTSMHSSLKPKQLII